ncbi:site-specific integrase [Clostridium aestuarii]|uniref:Site-specific integrase n=1 Tax=Clostridium aestuarii TaxID=338193 RepID=A0ABT4D268_9CLOT|nr:site-specific integrase [Clostridium aestuarii]MCY6485341.1 site-specific integrase [Clostridium aestuarii]
MRGHVRKRGKTYSFVVDIGRDENNKRKQKWYSGYKTKKEAEKALNDTLNKIEKGEYFISENISLKNYLRKWLEDYVELTLSTKTIKSYKEMIDWYIIPNIGNIPLNKLKPLNIQNFYKKCINEFNLSGTTTLYCHRILHKALKQAVLWQMLNSNPADAVEKPKKSKKQLQVLNTNHVEKLLNRLKETTLYMPVLLALTTGLRRGEICGLKWSDIDLENKTLYVKEQLQSNNGILELVPTKTAGSKRKIILLDFTLPILKQHRKHQLQNKLLLGNEYTDNNFVICQTNGNPYNPDYITGNFARHISKLSKELNIPKIRFHDLRHTHATLLLKQGINPKVVSERLGHSQVSLTLDTYSHVLPDMQKEAAEKLNDLLAK